MSEKEKEMETLKQVAMNGPTLDMMLKAVDAIGSYGEDAVPTLVELGNSATNPNVAARALEVLKWIKEEIRSDQTGPPLE